MIMHAAFVDALDAVREHLTRHALPELASLDVVHHLIDGVAITVQLADFRLADAARGLLAWADTLTGVTAELWRVPGRDSVHLHVYGQLAGGTPVKVYGAAPYDADMLGVDLEPNTRRTVSLDVLRGWASSGAGVTA